MPERINISNPEIDVEQSLANIQEVLESGQLAQGKFVERAEKLLAELMNSRYAALTNNGTASLKAAIVAGVCAIRDIDPAFIDRELAAGEIIVPAFSFNATLNAGLQLGTKVKLVDIEPDTFNMDPLNAVSAMTPNTLALVPVDLYGQPADTRELEVRASQDNVALVRDSAQAHGATIDDIGIAEQADATSLSFYATKNINSGEGGAVLTDYREVDEVVRMYRNQGMRRRYQYEMIGDNLRMSDVHAAILLTQLGKIASTAEARQKNAALLSEQLANVEGIETPFIAEGMGHVFHQYTIKVEPEFGMSRDELGARLEEANIGTGVYYPATMTEYAPYKDHPRIIKQATPVADEISKKVLSFPIYTKLSEGDITRIAESIKQVQADGK